MTMALIDVAGWDALAQAAGLPLARYLGADPRQMPAYNSDGLGLMPTAALADEAEQLLDGGFLAVNLRPGYAMLEEDVAAVRAVRERLRDWAALVASPGLVCQGVVTV